MCKLIFRLVITLCCLMLSVPVFAGQRATITEGWYKIVPAHSQNKALDVGGAKTNPGANIQLWDYVGADQQKFYIKHIQNRWYSIKAGNCDLYVDAQGGVPRNGENVHLWNWNGTDAQLWGFYDTGDGFNIETKMQSNLIFDCNGGRGDNGTNVQLWQKGNVAWHRWILIPVQEPVTKYVWPIPASKRITVRHTYSNGNIHSCRYYLNGNKRHPLGIDIAAAVGNSVYAIADGRVGTAMDLGNRSYGKYVEIVHNDGTKSLYAHLSYISVRVGQTVSKGQMIGRSGKSGKVSGAHLHFELSNKDPYDYYRSIGVL